MGSPQGRETRRSDPKVPVPARRGGRSEAQPSWHCGHRRRCGAPPSGSTARLSPAHPQNPEEEETHGRWQRPHRGWSLPRTGVETTSDRSAHSCPPNGTSENVRDGPVAGGQAGTAGTRPSARKESAARVPPRLRRRAPYSLAGERAPPGASAGNAGGHGHAAGRRRRASPGHSGHTRQGSRRHGVLGMSRPQRARHPPGEEGRPVTSHRSRLLTRSHCGGRGFQHRTLGTQAFSPWRAGVAGRGHGASGACCVQGALPLQKRAELLCALLCREVIFPHKSYFKSGNETFGG